MEGENEGKDGIMWKGEKSWNLRNKWRIFEMIRFSNKNNEDWRKKYERMKREGIFRRGMRI